MTGDAARLLEKRGIGVLQEWQAPLDGSAGRGGGRRLRLRLEDRTAWLCAGVNEQIYDWRLALLLRYIERGPAVRRLGVDVCPELDERSDCACMLTERI